MVKNSIFFCISNYNNDVRWLTSLGYDYVIFNKTHSGGPVDNNGLKKAPPSKLEYIKDRQKIIKSSINGYNIHDYLKFIIDNYENLPSRIAFIKGNVINRHVSKNFFISCLNKIGFVQINDNREHHNNFSLTSASALLSLDNNYFEKNNSFYLNNKLLTKKYFYSSSQFLKFCFNINSYHLYIGFPPGGCFIIDRPDITKYPKIFYQNLLTFVSYSRLPGEAHLLERLLPSIFISDLSISKKMKTKLKERDLADLQKEVIENSKFHKLLIKKCLFFFSKILGLMFIKITKLSNY